MRRRSRPSRKTNPRPRSGGGAGTAFEAEVLPGLEPYARAEIEAAGGQVDRVGEGEIGFTSERWDALSRLRRTVAVYRRLRFDVPRPKSLLGDRDFRRIVAALTEVRNRSDEPFRGFRFGAAGSDSPVFQRLASALQDATGLGHDPDGGELLIRVRPAESGGRGWEVLPRLTPRPLSARSWRVCNRPGGLNATAAVAAHDVALDGLRGAPGNVRYLNAMCGSGTLAIEWCLRDVRARAVAVDLAADAVGCTLENAQAARVRDRLEAFPADVTALPADVGTFDVATADVPWGDAVGSHDANERLYPAFLSEMDRVLAPNGVLVVVTHDVALFEAVLERSPAWRFDRMLRVSHSGHWPRIYRLTRLGGARSAS